MNASSSKGMILYPGIMGGCDRTDINLTNTSIHGMKLAIGYLINFIIDCSGIRDLSRASGSDPATLACGWHPELWLLLFGNIIEL